MLDLNSLISEPLKPAPIETLRRRVEQAALWLGYQGAGGMRIGFELSQCLNALLGKWSLSDDLL